MKINLKCALSASIGVLLLAIAAVPADRVTLGADGTLVGARMVAGGNRVPLHSAAIWVNAIVPGETELDMLASAATAAQFDDVALAVPEPDTLMMFATGLLGLGFLRARRRSV
jgi:hypothetical protein